MLVAGLVWFVGGAALTWRSADVAALFRATYRRLYGSSRYGEFAQRTADTASLRVFGVAFCGVGIVLVADSFI